MNVNLLGPFLLCKYLGTQMLAKGRGSIVNVASVAGLAGVSHRSAYNASKHGLIGLTRTLAAEWGGRGVRVNAVCPGWIKTEMDEADQGSGAYSDADIVNRVPMARFARADDVAEAIAFLADGERAGFVNGVTLPVDGGWIADASWESLRIRTRTRSRHECPHPPGSTFAAPSPISCSRAPMRRTPWICNSAGSSSRRPNRCRRTRGAGGRAVGGGQELLLRRGSEGWWRRAAISART